MIGHKDDSLLDEASIHTPRGWLNRTFSPLKKDSLRSSIFTMLMSAIGLGIFSFHKLFAEVGLLPACGLIIFYGGLFMLSIEFVIHSSKIAVHANSLGKLVEYSLGTRYNIFYTVVLFVSLYTTLVAQILSVSEMIFNNFGEAIFDFLEVPGDRRNQDVFVFYTVIWMGILMCVVLLINPSDKLGPASFLAFLIFLAISFVTVVQTPSYYLVNGNNLNLYEWSWHGFFHRSGLLVFAFNCLYNYYTVANNMVRPTVPRIRKVFRRTFLLIVSISVLLGCCFYLSLGPVHSAKVELFINRPKLGDTDYAMVVFRSLFIVSLLVSFVLTVEPCKAITALLLSPNQNHYFSAVFFSAGPAAIACGYRQITCFIGVSGAALTTIIVFTTPGLLAYHDLYFRKPWQRGLLIVFIVATLACGLYGSYLNLLDLFAGK